MEDTSTSLLNKDTARVSMELTDMGTQSHSPVVNTQTTNRTVDPNALISPTTVKKAAKPAATPVFVSYSVFTQSSKRVGLLWLGLRLAAVCCLFVSLFMRVFSKHYAGLLPSEACSTALGDGHWSPKFQWFPSSCAIAKYNPKQTATCLGAKESARVVAFGDSSMRAVFNALRLKLGAKKSDFANEADKKHQDLTSDVAGVHLQFLWDPFLNRTDVMDLVFGGADGPPKTSLVIFSAGSWFLRYGGPDQRAETDKFGEAVSAINNRINSAIEAQKPVSDVFFARLIPPFRESLLSNERKLVLKNSLRHDYNAKLFSLVKNGQYAATRKGELQLGKIGLHILTSTSDDMSLDGLHYIPQVDAIEVELLLNQICNGQQFSGLKMQGKTSCCVAYTGPRAGVWIIFLVTILFGPAVYYLHKKHSSFDPVGAVKLIYPTVQTSYAILILALTLISCRLVDRTHLFVKVNKEFNTAEFIIMNLIWIVPGFWSLRMGSDTTFLNREQTDEWKGWMQFAILVYHFTGGSKVIPIYSVIRVMVASYLFMTGFGHFTFFYKKGDFGLLRLARVLVRLNLLSIALSYTMETDTLFYYFGPLVSFWFLIVYAMMGIYSAGNANSSVLVGKLVFSGVLAYAFTHFEAVYGPFFKACEVFLGVRWNAKEAAFRLALDQWAVHFGMFCAWIMISIQSAEKSAVSGEASWVEHASMRLVAHWAAVKQWLLIASGLVLGVYAFVITFVPFGKETNNAYHPYMSLLVLGAFVVLRNATPDMRRTTSMLWRWIGGFSLETFILQYHVWMGIDTYGLVDLFGPGVAGGSYSGGGVVLRWFGVGVSSVLFLGLSQWMSDASGPLVEAVVVGALGKKPEARDIAMRLGVWIFIMVLWNYVFV